MATFSVFDGSTPSLLTDALLAPASGLVIQPGSVVVKASAADAVNLYDGSLAPIGIGSGLLLTSGTTPGTSNSVGWFGTDNTNISTPAGFYNGDADIDAVVNTVFATQSFDATTLEFDFTVSDPTATSISFDVVFGSDEYPEWVDQFVDAAVVLVNGVNHALFNHDPLHPLSVVSANLAAGYFQDNGAGVLPIEYDGVSHVLKIVAPILSGQTNHIKIGIADTGDHIYDSGIFIANLAAGTIPGSGVVITPPTSGTDSNDTVTGSSKDEYIDLKGGDDIAYAGAGDDIVVAGAGNDQVFGGSGNDELKGDGGNDLLDGGDGVSDTATYAGASSGYGFSYDAVLQSYTITDTNLADGDEGTDTLIGVEKVGFSDGLFFLNGSGALSAVAPPPPPTEFVGLVIVSGIAAAGNTLTATVSDANGVPGAIAHQWQVSSDLGVSWTNLGGATAATYDVQPSDKGRLIRVVATYTDGDGFSEVATSVPKPILDSFSGDLKVTLLQLTAPAGSSLATPLTTLLQRAIDLGLSPSVASETIKTVLGIPADVKLQSYDAYGALLANPDDPIAQRVEMVAVQAGILTSLSDDDTGIQLALAILNAAANGATLDLGNGDDLAAILGINNVDPTNYANYNEILNRNSSIASDLVDGKPLLDSLNREWKDVLSIIDATSTAGITIFTVPLNLAPVGSPSATLAVAGPAAPYLITSDDLLAGFSDPNGDPLAVSDLIASGGGDLVDNGDGTWTFTPTAGFTGAVELSYAVIDGQGGSIAAFQLFGVAGSSPGGGTDTPATGSLAVTGAAAEGGSLSAALSDVVDADGATTTAYQWQGDVAGSWTDLAGQTAATLAIPSDQSFVGRTVRVVATSTDPLGGSTPFTSAGQTIANVNDGPGGAVSISGLASEGQVLTASDTLSDADGLGTISYGWFADGVDTGVSGTSYSLAQADVGRVFTVRASYVDGYGANESVSSDPTSPVANVDQAATGTLTVTGTAAEGGSLTAALSAVVDADGATTTAYQWQEALSGSWSDLAGANTATLAIPSDQSFVGRSVRVVATSTDVLGGSTAFASAAQTIANVNDAPAGAVTLAGLLQEGQTLSAKNTLTDADGLGPVSYQWFAGSSITPFASGGTYLLTAADVGQVLHVVASYVDGYGSAEQVASASTAAVVALPPPPSGDNLSGTKGADSLSGGAGDDTLAGLDGNDTLVGLEGNDRLDGGHGRDRLFGAAGNDVYVVDSTKDVVIETDADPLTGGIDRIESSVSITLSANVENLVLTGSRGITGKGNGLANVLIGNGGANVVRGAGGADVLTGGGGADSFRFDPGDSNLLGFDQITDFMIGSDRIDGPSRVRAGAVQKLGAVAALDEASIGAILSGGSFRANGASVFTYTDTSPGALAGTRTFLALNDGNVAFSATADGLIEITGYSGNLNNLAVI